MCMTIAPRMTLRRVSAFFSLVASRAFSALSLLETASFFLLLFNHFLKSLANLSHVSPPFLASRLHSILWLIP